MLKPLLAPYVLFVLLTSSAQQPVNTPPQPAATAQPATAAPQAANAGPHMGIPVDAAQTVNPVKPTAESLARAKKVYGYDCAMCHGEKGDGKGDAVADLKLAMKDYTDPAALKDYSDGELFYIIRHGRDKMPGEEEARAKPDDVWNLVLLIRSFSKGKAGSVASVSHP